MSLPERQIEPEQTMPLIGERIVLDSGATLEKPSTEVIAWLQEQDPRVHYFPTDIDAAQRATTPGSVYSSSIAESIGRQVQHDFPGADVSVRGTVAALTEPFPYWDNDAGTDMRTVLDILASGSDTGADRTRVGQLVEDGKLNHHTLDWLEVHATSVLMEVGEPERSQVFPVLLVYPPSSFEAEPAHGWNMLTGDPSQRLSAVYITDRVL